MSTQIMNKFSKVRQNEISFIYAKMAKVLQYVHVLMSCLKAKNLTFGLTLYASMLILGSCLNYLN